MARLSVLSYLKILAPKYPPIVFVIMAAAISMTR
jgi:hypothetical protein